MGKKEKCTAELERRRIARRERYKKIKSNPEKYTIEKAKKREAYLKRKEENKQKSIKQLGKREQRAQRKRWRENSRKYLEKKKKDQKIEEITLREEVNEAVTDITTTDPLNIAANVKNKGNKNTIYQYKIKALKNKHKREKAEMSLLIKKYQNRCQILRKTINKLRNQLNRTTESNNAAVSTDKCRRSDLPKDKAANKRSKVDLRKKCLRDSFLKKMNRFNDNVQEIVKNTYEDDINSRICPGKKQFVKKFGIQKQKRYLLDSIKNIHKKFLEENPNIRISYVTFSRLRPFWVYLPRDDRETCACSTHTNIDLIISSLRKNKILDIKNGQDMLDVLCCSKYNTKCVARICEICKSKTLAYKEFNNEEDIEYQEWCKDKKNVGLKQINIVKKFTRKIKPRNLINKLELLLPSFLTHTVNILHQYQTIHQLKKSIDNNETLLHMDFSENYSYKFTEEIQSLHFGGSRGQVSLHTVVAYVKEGRETVNYSLCTVSECTRHDSPAVWAHLQKALEFVLEKCPNIAIVHILTDSPTSQYRNKHIFYIMTQIRNAFPHVKLVTWNYSEAGHGKGAPDGIGAVVKRSADYQVKCGNDVGDFSEFLNIVRRNVKNVEIRVVNEHEIIEKQIMLPQDITPFKGTMSVHQVIWKSNCDFLEFRRLSCFLCIDKICEHDNIHMQLHKIYKSVIESNVQNVKIYPPNKIIRVLSNIPVPILNQNNKPSTSGLQKPTKISKPKKISKGKEDKEFVVTLAEAKDSWANQTFIDNQPKVAGHEKEFFRFINNIDKK